MELIPLEDLSVKTFNAEAEFGLLLPDISSNNGYKVTVHIIHEFDQFLQNVNVVSFDLKEEIHVQLNIYGSYWHTKLDLSQHKAKNSSHWGTPGKYLYRYSIESNNGKKVDYITDPFANEFGMGNQSAFTIGGNGGFSWSQAPEEPKWKVPHLKNLIVYQLMIHEFISDFKKAIRMLDYLADLGVNALEIMPLSNLERTVDWGHEPLTYFGVDERFGDSNQLKLFIAEAHKRGIAIIADLVCGHVSELFPYVYIYDQLNFSVEDHPFYGVYGDKQFKWGKKADYNKKLVQDFYFTVCNFWLEHFHVDGIRYDNVPEFYEKSNVFNPGFSNLVYHVHQLVKSKKDDKEWSRFFNGHNQMQLIQCAEYLEEPEEILYKTYSNCAWQSNTLQAAVGVAKKDPGALKRFGIHLGLTGLPSKVELENEIIEKSAFQYLENHNHPRFICNFKTVKSYSGNEKKIVITSEGDRSQGAKVQPYLIALFTGKGIPMLWQGQEILENYNMPETGQSTVRLLRSFRWDYFYTNTGRETLSLVRKLVKIRKKYEQFRLGEYDFWNNHEDYLSKGIMIFTREFYNKYSLVMLNFTEKDVKVPINFKYSGSYIEEIHHKEMYFNNGYQHDMDLPANSGFIWNLLNTEN